MRGTHRESPGQIQQKRLLYTEIGSSTSQHSGDFISDEFSSDVDSFSSERINECNAAESKYEFHISNINLHIKRVRILVTLAMKES